MQFFKKIDFNKVNIFLIAFLIISILFSKMFISISEILLMLVWLVNKDFKYKIQQIKENKSLLVFLLIYVVSLISLSYTSDFKYALKDLNIKLPLIILPITLSSVTFIKQDLKYLFTLLIFSVFAKTIVSIYILIFGHYNSVKEIAFNISHIRFSLIINFAILLCFYYYSRRKEELNKIEIRACIFFMFWFIGFLFLLQSFTGLVVFIVLSFILLLKWNFKETRKINKYLAISFLLIFFVSITFYISSVIFNYYDFEKVDFSKLEKLTPSGNSYEHDTVSKIIENKSYVWIYICQKELSEEWNKRSEIIYDSTDRAGNLLKYTLIRYLNSKNLRKDKDGVLKLSDNEIIDVEKGIANYKAKQKFSITYKIETIIGQIDSYLKGSDPSGQSITQRFEYWKIGLEIIKKNLFFGVGVGDIQDEYKNQYVEGNSMLDIKFQKGAHNQYLTFIITYGIIGASIILFCLIFPFFKNRKYKEFLPTFLFLIMLISMLNEDTLETQLGVTFFSLFYSILILNKKSEKSL